MSFQNVHLCVFNMKICGIMIHVTVSPHTLAKALSLMVFLVTLNSSREVATGDNCFLFSMRD